MLCEAEGLAKSDVAMRGACEKEGRPTTKEGEVAELPALEVLEEEATEEVMVETDACPGKGEEGRKRKEGRSKGELPCLPSLLPLLCSSQR